MPAKKKAAATATVAPVQTRFLDKLPIRHIRDVVRQELEEMLMRAEIDLHGPVVRQTDDVDFTDRPYVEHPKTKEAFYSEALIAAEMLDKIDRTVKRYLRLMHRLRQRTLLQNARRVSLPVEEKSTDSHLVVFTNEDDTTVIITTPANEAESVKFYGLEKSDGWVRNERFDAQIEIEEGSFDGRGRGVTLKREVSNV